MIHELKLIDDPSYGLEEHTVFACNVLNYFDLHNSSLGSGQRYVICVTLFLQFQVHVSVFFD